MNFYCIYNSVVLFVFHFITDVFAYKATCPLQEGIALALIAVLHLKLTSVLFI